MPLECAMTFSNDIVGSNTKGGRANTSAVIEFEHEVYSPVDEQEGSVSGARVHKAAHVTKEIDTASPSLFQACCTGQTLDEIKIDFYKITPAGKEEIYYTITMNGVKVASVKEVLPNTKDPAKEKLTHLEEVRFLYEKINWKHADGYEFEDSWAGVPA